MDGTRAREHVRVVAEGNLFPESTDEPPKVVANKDVVKICKQVSRGYERFWKKRKLKPYPVSREHLEFPE